MKAIKITAITALIVVCATALVMTVSRCTKNGLEAAVKPKYCVGMITGVAPADNQVCCVGLKKGDVVCIPCQSAGCDGIWEGTRRSKLISGVCKVVIEISNDNDCKSCPDTAKLLDTAADKNGLFWRFTKKE